MPSSSIVGKAVIAMVLSRLHARHSIQSIIDVGPGAGTYRRLFGDILPGARWTGVEIWAPYVTKYRLESLYDTIYVSDATCFDFSMLDNGEVAIIGDVIEHISKGKIRTLTDRILEKFDLAILSIPVGNWPQEEVGGNPWERHVDSWTLEDISEFFGACLAGVSHTGFNGAQGLAVVFLTKSRYLRPELTREVEICDKIVGSANDLIYCGLGFCPNILDHQVVSQFIERVSPFCGDPVATIKDA